MLRANQIKGLRPDPTQSNQVVHYSGTSELIVGLSGKGKALPAIHISLYRRNVHSK